MSREALSTFIHAAEYRLSIQKELSETHNIEEVIKVAQKYGFIINPIDFEQDSSFETIETWFRKSKINPIRDPNKII